MTDMAGRSRKTRRPRGVKSNTLKRLLLVEDDKLWRDQFLRLIDYLSGWEVVVATSHEDLVAKLAAGQFGALLLDESLWEMKGVYEHQAAIQAQVAGGARLFCLSSSRDAAADMAKTFGTEVSAAWGKLNLMSASSADLLAAIEG